MPDWLIVLLFMVTWVVVGLLWRWLWTSGLRIVDIPRLQRTVSENRGEIANLLYRYHRLNRSRRKHRDAARNMLKSIEFLTERVFTHELMLGEDGKTLRLKLSKGADPHVEADPSIHASGGPELGEAGVHEGEDSGDAVGVVREEDQHEDDDREAGPERPAESAGSGDGGRER